MLTLLSSLKVHSILDEKQLRHFWRFPDGNWTKSPVVKHKRRNVWALSKRLQYHAHRTVDDVQLIWSDSHTLSSVPFRLLQTSHALETLRFLTADSASSSGDWLLPEAVLVLGPGSLSR